MHLAADPITLDFEILTNSCIKGEDCPWKRVKAAMPIPGYPGLEESLDSAGEWIDQFMTQHLYCRKNKDQKLPTRLIEVTLPDGSNGVRLYETNEETGQYDCLSHRWMEGHTITTTLSNIDERKKLIEWEELPKAFQDAIFTVRRLGLRYI